jgi:hypothetical protein
MDDHGNLSPEEEEGRKLVEMLEFLDVVATDESRKAALDRGLPTLALNLLIERATSDDPVVREEARGLIAELGLELALPDVEPEAPDDD